MADRGYVRQTPNGPPPAEQHAAIMGAGVQHDNWVYHDLLPKGRGHCQEAEETLPERRAVIRDLRPGSRLVVSSLDRLGMSGIDITTVIREVTAKECVVYAVDTGKTYAIPPEVGAVLDDSKDAEVELKRERVRKARAVRTITGATGGNKGWRPPPETEQAARHNWLNDLSLSQADLEKKYGVGRSTLRRKFGERGVPKGRRPSDEK
jgi:DNA invertase Pin-like site-specific DNA recombinase